MNIQQVIVKGKLMGLEAALASGTLPPAEIIGEARTLQEVEGLEEAIQHRITDLIRAANAPLN